MNQAPGMALVEVERMGSSDGTVSVNFSAQAGTATAGVDFIATNLVLTWTNNDLATKSVPVVVLAGQPAGGDKTVLLTLHDPAGAGLSTPSAATLTLFQSVPSQTLTNFTDAGLRTAVTNGGRILFANDGTLTLTSTLYITTATTLEANGHQVVLSGNAACRLFYVAPGGVLTLNDLTITKGAAAGASGTGTNVNGEPAYGGAAFVAQGVLNVIGCHVWTNVANGGVGGPGITTGGDALGGAFYVHGGTLNLTNSDLVGNLAAGGAGGIQNPGNSQPTGNGGRAFGGAVFNAYGTLSLSTDLFLANQAVGGKAGLDASFGVSQASGDAQGGALCQAGGTGQISACDFEANAVSSLRPPGTISGSGGNVRGGAVCNSNGWLSIEACTFMNNMALGGNGVHHDAPGNGLGGAIANSDQMQLDTCWLANNTVSGGAASTAASMAIGGAVYNEGTLGATCSLVASNAASNIGLGYSTAEGGAVANLGACGLTNVTLYANLAAGGQKGSQILGLGGGLFNSVGTATLVNCTIAGNLAGSLPHAPGPGGGVLNSNGSVFLLNALLADNHLGSNACGQITDGGHNLSSDGSCNFTAPGSLNRANPVLGPLADYGGATSTMPLLAGSPAIDGGAATGAPASDQRGHARPYGTAPDIGAFESSPPYMIRGSVSGFSLKNEVTVAAGGVSQLTTNGSYQLAGLAPGFYSVTPTHPDYLFIPASQNLTVGPDQLGVNFHAYHWNMISVEGISNRMVQVVVASTNSGTTRLLSSSNLRDWSPCLTNQLGADHTARYALPTTSPVLFYRAVTP